jgi:hypothetical protein
MGIEPVPIKIFGENEEEKKFKKTVTTYILSHLTIEKSQSQW